MDILRLTLLRHRSYDVVLNLNSIIKVFKMAFFLQLRKRKRLKLHMFNADILFILIHGHLNLITVRTRVVSRYFMNLITKSLLHSRAVILPTSYPHVQKHKFLTLFNPKTPKKWQNKHFGGLSWLLKILPYPCGHYAYPISHTRWTYWYQV